MAEGNGNVGVVGEVGVGNTDGGVEGAGGGVGGDDFFSEVGEEHGVGAGRRRLTSRPLSGWRRRTLAEQRSA